MASKGGKEGNKGKEPKGFQLSLNSKTPCGRVHSGGARAMAGGCAVFGAFSAVVEKLQPFASAMEH